ncbi:MAG: hypothetical protein ACRDSF_09205, partial [Pseudonocardiaceae bacterium]
MSRRGRVLRALAMVLLFATLSAGLLTRSGSTPPPSQAASSPSSPTPSSPLPEPPPEPPPTSPFTGLPTDLGAPVLA